MVLHLARLAIVAVLLESCLHTGSTCTGDEWCHEDGDQCCVPNVLVTAQACNDDGDVTAFDSCGFELLIDDCSDPLNEECANHYLYSNSEKRHDGDAGYDVNTELGSWTVTNGCHTAEGGDLRFWAGMR